MQNKDIDNKTKRTRHNADNFWTDLQTSLNSDYFVLMEDVVNYLEGLGYKRSTIFDHIKRHKADLIRASVRDGKAKAYGLNDTNNRHVYISLKIVAEGKLHLDAIFDMLGEKKSLTEIEAGIGEVELYGNRNYILDSSQFDILVDKLKDSNDEIKHKIFAILSKQARSYNSLPTNRTVLIDVCKKILKTHPLVAELQNKTAVLVCYDKKRYISPTNSFIPHILYLLSYCNDSVADVIIIQRLGEDIEAINEVDFSSVAPMYADEKTASVINRNDTELFEIKKKLMHKGKSKKAELLDTFRWDISPEHRKLIGNLSKPGVIIA